MSFPTVPLGSVCEVLDRLRKPITKWARKAGEFPYYGATGIVDYVDGFLFDEPLVLLGEDGAKWGPGENSAFAASGRYWVNNHAHIMRPNRGKLIDDWLIYYLNWQDLSPFITGLTVPKLNQERMREIPIPLPPLEEQRRIVAVLDEAFAAIASATANAEKNLVNARELFESELRTLFNQEAETNRKRRLGDVLRTSAGGTPLSKKKDYYEAGTIPWLLSGEVGQREITTATRFITDAGLEASSAKYYPINSVLVAMYGATAGEAGILRFQSTSNQAVCAIHPDENFVPEYVYYFIRSQYDELVAQAVGNAQPNISQAKIREMLLPITPVDAQKAVVARLNAAWNAAETLSTLQEQKVGLLSDLKQSLLHRAFSVELTQREPLAA